MQNNFASKKTNNYSIKGKRDIPSCNMSVNIAEQNCYLWYRNFWVRPKTFYLTPVSVPVSNVRKQFYDAHVFSNFGHPQNFLTFPKHEYKINIHHRKHLITDSTIQIKETVKQLAISSNSNGFTDCFDTKLFPFRNPTSREIVD